MVKTIVFKKDNSVLSYDDKYTKPSEDDLVVWTHIVSNEDKVIDIVLEELGQGTAFEEDLLEDQRPRLTVFDDYTVVVISAPMRKILKSEEDYEEITLQVSFIINKKFVISVSDQPAQIIEKLMERFVKRRPRRITPTKIFSKVFEEIVENVISVIELVDKRIDAIQSNIVKGQKLEGFFKEVEEIKENLFYTNKILRADLEVVREILFGKSELINTDEFNAHIEDRLLYAVDILETARESLNGINNLYMAALSNRMNTQMYKLTIIGSFLLIPTMVASFWGMNVPLPINNFWVLVLLSIVLSVPLGIWFVRMK